MIREQVFLDTSGLLAVANRDDALHAEATEAWRELARSGVGLLTTDWVLAEFLGSSSRLATRQDGISVVRAIRSSARTETVSATRTAWQTGFELYQARLDKEWSLVDCISIRVCEAHSVRRAFTHDHHFEQAGFEVLL